ncbi:MAG: hypothetical protein ABIK83_15735 [Candidatus Zixiibacteriota bacterium]
MRFLASTLMSALILTTSALAGTPVKPENISKAAGTYTKGRLYLPELEFDFGMVPQEASISHSFWIQNKGLDTLEIIQIKPG